MTASSPEYALFRHRSRAVRILSVVDVAQNVRSLSFKDKSCSCAKPGQFGMVWVPGTDEVPMSLLPSSDDDFVTIVVRERGNGTKALSRKAKGDLIGIRGPYGKGFSYTDEQSVLMIAGGTGAVPLLGLLRKLVSRGVKCSFVLGANTARELLFPKEIERISTQSGGVFTMTTDDGSAGSKGLATDEAARLSRVSSFDRVYTCGPEVMMKRVIDLAAKGGTPVEAGVERIFKCGSGICGSCCLGPYLVCRDGPVFSGETLRELTEFGKSTRDASGKRIALGAL